LQLLIVSYYHSMQVDSNKAVEIDCRLDKIGEAARVDTPKCCDTDGIEVCTFNGQILRQLDETSCGDTLFEIQPH